LHERLLTLRHEALAHSDFDRKPTRRIKSLGPGFLVSSMPFDVLSERIDMKLFRSICTKMKNHCYDKLFQLDRQMKEHGKEKDREI